MFFPLPIDKKPWKNGELFLASLSARAPADHAAAEQTCSDQGGKLFPSADVSPVNSLKMYHYMQHLDNVHKTGRVVTYTSSSKLVEMVARNNRLEISSDPSSTLPFLIFCKRSEYSIYDFTDLTGHLLGDTMQHHSHMIWPQ